jgi:hypothetical protein
MSFARQNAANRVRSPQKHLTVAPQVSRKGAGTISAAEDTQPNPLASHWVRSLLFAQRGTAILCFLLVGGMLGVYTLTVYTQQLWTREYRKLEELQRQERQMTAANEVLKNSLADSAKRPESGLLPTGVGNSFFITPAPQRRFIPDRPPELPQRQRPLGY